MVAKFLTGLVTRVFSPRGGSLLESPAQRFFCVLWGGALFFLLIPRVLDAGIYNQRMWILSSQWVLANDMSGVLSCVEAVSPHHLDSFLHLSHTRAQLASSFVNEGRSFWLEGNCSEAAASWQRALLYDSYNPAALMGLWFLGYPPPESVKGSFSLFAFEQGRIADRRADHTAAATWYEYSIAASPARPAVEELIQIYLYLGDTDKAVGALENLAESVDTRTADYWWAQGQILELQENWQEAALAYEQGAALATTSEDFLIRAGNAWLRAEVLSSAERAYSSALVLNPELPAIYVGLGHVRRAQLQYEQAMVFYENASRLAPNSAEPYLYLGRTLHDLGQEVAARQAFSRVLELRPKHASSAYYMAESWYADGYLDEAVHWLSRAVEWNAGRSWWWPLLLGDWQCENGDLLAAHESYCLAVELGADPALISQRLVDISILECP